MGHYLRSWFCVAILATLSPAVTAAQPDPPAREAARVAKERRALERELQSILGPVGGSDREEMQRRIEERLPADVRQLQSNQMTLEELRVVIELARQAAQTLKAQANGRLRSDPANPLRSGRLSGQRPPTPLRRDNAVSIEVVTSGQTTRAIVSSGSVSRTAWSPEELRALVGETHTVLQNGEDLPAAWREVLGDRRVIRVTPLSPKLTLREHLDAGALADRPATPANTKVFSALPGGGSAPIEQQLRDMQLSTDEAERWKDLHDEMSDVGETGRRFGFAIEPATRAAILDEWYTGTSTQFILVGHYDESEGKFYLPNGEAIAIAELNSRRRALPPTRVIVLISCNTGRVNATLHSPAEKLIQTGAAKTVIAPTEQVSALTAPELLRAVFLGGQTMREIFVKHHYQIITMQSMTPSRDVG